MELKKSTWGHAEGVEVVRPRILSKEKRKKRTILKVQ